MVFYVRESSIDGEYAIGVNAEEISKYKLTGSYNILCARACGLKYTDFLRMAIALYHATPHGKKGYSYISFKEKSDAAAMCNMLNRQYAKIAKILGERLEEEGENG